MDYQTEIREVIECTQCLTDVLPPLKAVLHFPLLCVFLFQWMDR